MNGAETVSSRPSPATDREAASPPQESFRDGILGPLSSHPRWLDRRDAWIRRTAVSALGTLWMLAVFNARRIERWIADPPAQGERFLWIGVAATFIVAAMAAVALSGRVILKWHGPRLRNTSGLDKPAEMIVLSVCVLLVLCAAVLLVWMPGLPPLARLAMHLVGMLPLVVLLLALRIIKPKPRTGYTLRRRHGWLLLSLLLVAAATLGTLFDTGALRSLSWLGRAYESLGVPFAGLMLCSPIAFLAWAAWMTSWRLVRLPAQEGEGSTLSRFWRWMKGLFGIGTEPSESIPPNWLSDVLTDLPKDFAAELPALRAPAVTSPQAARPELCMFFGGHMPTLDQASALDAFASAYARVITASALDGSSSSGTGHGDEASADFLVLGDPGAGRTMLLLAYALYATIVRGQQVLMLCASSTGADALRRRAGEQLQASRLDPFIPLARLTAEVVDHWLLTAQSERAADRPAPPVELPSIVVATVDEVERHLFGCPRRDEPSVDRLAEVLRLFDVVIVDDLLTADASHRAHLPFTIDKLRLLSEAELLPLQVIAATSRLSMIGARRVGDRLFARRYRDENVRTLRPRAVPAGWHVAITHDDPAAAVETLAAACLIRGLSVVVYRPGVDAIKRDELRGRILVAATTGIGAAVNPSASGDDPLRIVGDLDDLPDGAVHAESVLHQFASDHDAAIELRLRAPEGDIRASAPVGADGKEMESSPVILTVRSPASRSAPQPLLPVVVDRTAAPLLAAHLRSAQRLLPALTPIHKDALLQFGIRTPTLPRGFPPRPQAAFGMAGGDADNTIALDEYHGHDPALLRRAFPIAYQQARSLAVRAIDVSVQPQDDLAVFATPAGDRVFVALHPGAAARTQGDTGLAMWRLENGLELGMADLVHETRLVLDYQGNTYVPQQIIAAGGGHGIAARGRDDFISIIATHFAGDDSSDAIFPIVDLTFDVPASVRIGDNVAAFEDIFLSQLITEPDPVSVNMAIVGRCAGNGATTPGERIQFGYPARLSVLVLSPTNWPPEQLSETLSNGLSGRWGTNQNHFDPALTAAVTRTFADLIPGVEYFARFVAARPRNPESFGEAVIWVIEPIDTGRTASIVLFDALRHAETRSAIWSHLTQLRGGAIARATTPEQLRAISRFPTTGDLRLLPAASVAIPNRR